MKSIKEKSNEYAREYLFSPLPHRAPNIHFEAGANYVLDILEKGLPLEDDRNLNDYGKAFVWRLKNCIEQLKK